MRMLAAALMLCVSCLAAQASRCQMTNAGRVVCGPGGGTGGHPVVHSNQRRGRIVAHPKGCPRVAFCGCGVSVWAYGHSVRSLWLARAYFQFPRVRPAKGKVAIFRGGRHVAGIIKPYGDGTALLYDPNSGHHLTRIHRRSIRHAVIVDPHAHRVASR